MSGSPRLDSPFLFPALPHVPYLLPPVPEVRGRPARSAKREYGLHRRVLPLHILDHVYVGCTQRDKHAKIL